MTEGIAGILCTLSVEGALVAENQGFTFTGNQGTIDLTNRDSNWWAEHISGVRDWEISGDGLYIYSDLARKKLQTHYFTRSPATLTCILTLADGAATFTGECTLTTFTLPAPPHDKAGHTFSLKGTGALTPAPAS